MTAETVSPGAEIGKRRTRKDRTQLQGPKLAVRQQALNQPLRS